MEEKKIINVLIKKCSKCNDYQMMLVNNVLKLDGDYYHDKIDYMIQGFIRGLQYAGYIVSITNEEFICEYCKDDLLDED